MAFGRSQYHQMSGSVHNDSVSSNYLPEQRPYDERAAWDRYPLREQAQYGIPQNPNPGFNRSTSALRNQQPVYNRVPSHTANEQYGSRRQYRPLDRNEGTSSSRAEMPSYGNVHALYPALIGNGSCTSRTRGTDGRYHYSETSQPSPQHNTYGLKTSYGGVYKNTYNSQTNPVAGYQQSPYLLPGQEPHDVNNPPSAFQPGPAAMMQRNTTAVQPPPTQKTKAKQRNDSIESSSEDEEPKQEPKKDGTKKIQNAPRTRCATLRKTIHKHGETKTVNGQLMWLDPNEPAHKKWSKLQPHPALLEQIDLTLTLCRAGSSHG